MTQKQFYKSQAWRRARAAYISQRRAIDGGLCEVCGMSPGLIVHHVIWLNDVTCNNEAIALNSNNFRLECQTCHNKERDPRIQPPGRAVFNESGEVTGQNGPPP